MRRPGKILTIVGMLLALSYPASTFAIDFADPVSYPVGTGPAGVVVADFNGDGKPDIAVANNGSGNISILLGNGNGTFRAAVDFDAGIAFPFSVAVDDFNGDGKLDLAVFQPRDPNTLAAAALSVLLGNGDGSFRAPQTMTLTSSATRMTVADFNLDGKPDLALQELDPNTNNWGVDIFLGNGDGTFQPPRNTLTRALLFVVADFNGDGKPDLAVPFGGGVGILLGNGDGTFQAALAPTVDDGFVVQNVQAGDINGDGKVDLVIESDSTSKIRFCFSGVCTTFPSSHHIRLFLGNGNASFREGQIIANASLVVSRNFQLTQISIPTFGDFNGDGKLDLGYLRTTLPSNVKSFEVKLGKGDGTFSPVVGLPNPGDVLAVADLNSDKNSDLVVSGSGSDIGAVLNTSPASGADLAIIAGGASAEPAGVGLNLTYTANVLNLGPKDATGVTFTDTLPNGISFVSANATQGSCIQSNGIITCDVGALASAFDASITIVVTPTVTGMITNTMRVSATEADLVPANNSATQNTTVVPVYTLTVSKTGNGSGTVNSDTGVNGPIGCGSTCAAAFLGGTIVSLTATPSRGATFGGWSGACTGADPNSCAVALTSDRSVTATFNIPADFSLSPESTSLTMHRGGQVSDTLTFPAQGGFSGAIALACSVSGPAPMPTCGILPNSVAPGGSATLTVSATAMSASLRAPWLKRGDELYVAWLPLGLLGCACALGFDKKRRRVLALCLLLIVATILPAACGGGSSGPPPPAQNYTVTVTATSGALQHSIPISVTVR
jgi:uncharacterized repeat protein (TIGR01451 family)